MPSSSPVPETAPDPDVTATYQHVDAQPLDIDIYLPRPNPDETARRAAAVLCLHGGGWCKGGRHQFAWHARDLAQHGVVAAAASYRLAPGATYPAAVMDAGEAIRWLMQQADRFNFDQTRVGVVGSSAGGHLAACLGVGHPRTHHVAPDGMTPKPHPGLRCVVDIHGIHDFSSLDGHASCIRFIGGDDQQKAALWDEASPMRFVHRDSAAFLLFHDPDDPLVPFDQSVRFADALRRVGGSARLIRTPGSRHGFIYDARNLWSRRVWPVARRWLCRRLM